ncbi:MAG TPA: PorP/SprF family type IX secretion system membrane protein [Flavitalea sp.]|nr:PorP/SprF family type IX secretion system membrane protein [Flavitalea sp.]
MTLMRHLILFLLFTISAGVLFGQDPSFSQFFSSPLNINPALTARINSKWRVISNLRDQWIGPASPYASGTISYDTRALEKQMSENTVFGIGGMLMYNSSMRGIHKSTFGSLNLSYNVLLAADEAEHRIGIGIGGIYGNKSVDFSRLYFPEQFIGTGFDQNLPTGEPALKEMKPYLSSSAGILYSFTTTNSNLDLGAAAYHLNKPKQTFLENENQYLPMRYVAHANFETYLTDQFLLNTNAIYQQQAKTNYFSVGGALGYYLSNDYFTQTDVLVNVGLWYWSNNAIVPYFGFSYSNMQVGLSYDITISKLRQATRKPKTFEVSLIIRGDKKNEGVIWCPWK